MSVPEKVLTNQDLERMVNTSDEWIRSRTGVSERHISEPHQSASYFAIRAAQEALDRAGVPAESLDIICVATVTADHLFPGTASLVQEAIGAKNAGAFDLGAACAGFIYGCEIVGSMIQNGTVERALLIPVDVLTKFVNWEDRSTCILFGDGGGAIYMEAGDGERGLIAGVMRSDGSGAKHITIDMGGSRYPFCSPESKGRINKIYMAGPEVYRFAVAAMGESCRAVLKKAGMSVDDVDLFVPHQANLRIITAASDRLGLPREKVYIHIEKYGNMAAGSIPIALYEAEREGRLKKGDVLMTVGFGAGLVWGANLIRW
ncbi:MAG: ketoacyl-ACP synthase III [Armatimonadetes bacterium]|nr:ketoacyl-ACP synthase III [Armatimonadota bacterium]